MGKISYSEIYIMQPGRNAVGGPYLGVHLRRRDFAWGRPKDVPNVENAAKQLRALLIKLNLDVAFIATDASQTGKY